MEVTGREPVRRMIAAMDRDSPDAVVLAGDIGNPSFIFAECLAEFHRLGVPVLVLAGNHDVWISQNESSAPLFTKILPRVTRGEGYFWLDGDEPFLLEDRDGQKVGIAGSMAWYDYSARDPERGLTDEQILAMKPRFAMDARCVDWPQSDQEFAAACRERLRKQLDVLEADPDVKAILVVTHVPIFDNQMDRRPEDDFWTLGNPFFGHFTMGEDVARYSKVRWVVSGHTHVAMNGVVEREGMTPIATAVVGSDYHKPRYLIVDAE